MHRWIVAIAFGLMGAARCPADVVTRAIEYKDGDTRLEGLLAYDGAVGGRRGGVLIASEGPATGAAARHRAIDLARLGYVALVADLFGSGAAARDEADAKRRLRLHDTDRSFVRNRAEAALTALTRQPQADPKRIAAVGYGVGGTAWLELARTGADLEGVAIVHGELLPSATADDKKISASVLVIVGSEDPKIPTAQIAAFEEEMRSGGIDWQVLRLGGVGHDFTNPQAGRNLGTGAAYDADADKRAAAAIRSFLAEALAPPAGTPANQPAVKPSGISDKVLRILEYVSRHGEPPDGYEGGRTFGNFERRLPLSDSQGRRIKYREWDVNPLRPGVNRGPERLITGSDGSAYFSDDHYRSFKKIR